MAREVRFLFFFSLFYSPFYVLAESYRRYGIDVVQLPTLFFIFGRWAGSYLLVLLAWCFSPASPVLISHLIPFKNGWTCASKPFVCISKSLT
ncbi:hypothetical protein BDW62DRAFT_132039 [Aspergillus aurantiobrunneus]